MNPQDLRNTFIRYFIGKNHKQIPSALLIPDDSTTLFTSSGMQQLVPYLKGEQHPMGRRLVDCQPCFRSEDIEEIGDNRHTTFFEMLGNWSLGDYFKSDQLRWFFEFLTEIIGIDPGKLYVTVFDGDKVHRVIENGKQQVLTPDLESIKIWKELFKTEKHKLGKEGFDPEVKIYEYGPEKNWWSRSGLPAAMPVGEIGGPDSEVFYDFGEKASFHENSLYKNETCHLNCECGRFLEIGNSVFMQYEKVAEHLFKPLPQKNVDFGGGLERILAASQNKPDIFQIELFEPIINEIEKSSGKKYQEEPSKMRIIADHIRAACFMAQQNLEPSNKREGYIMRRLIRRSVVKMMQLDIVPRKFIPSICQSVLNTYGDLYFSKKNYEIHPVIGKEVDSFEQTINNGTKMLQTKEANGKLLFDLYQTYGFPIEISTELLKEWGRPIAEKELHEFKEEKEKHQQTSRTASKGMFRGGLADHSTKITKLHTATHLLHASLRRVLGENVRQVGSNITVERLRFDFTHPDKLNKDQLKQIEQSVNEQIKRNLPVTCEIMTLRQAEEQGALAFFGQKYPEKVKVYTINGFSKEVCGGPHVDFTGNIGTFRIIKEEAVGTGKRRIYATIN